MDRREEDARSSQCDYEGSRTGRLRRMRAEMLLYSLPYHVRPTGKAESPHLRFAHCVQERSNKTYLK